MTKQPTLQELFAIAKHQAFRIFHDKGEILPMWHAIASDGQHLIIANDSPSTYNSTYRIDHR